MKSWNSCWKFFKSFIYLFIKIILRTKAIKNINNEHGNKIIIVKTKTSFKCLSYISNNKCFMNSSTFTFNKFSGFIFLYIY